MAYQKIGFKNGNVLTAEQLIHMEDGIIDAGKKAASGGGTGTGLPSDVGAYKYMATDGEGKWVAADRLAYKTFGPATATITWDGNTDGLETGGNAYFKVSNQTISKSQLLGQTLTLAENGRTIEIIIDEANVDEQPDGNLMIKYGKSALVYSFVNPSNVASAGLWFLLISPTIYVSKLEYLSETIHAIPDEYLNVTWASIGSKFDESDMQTVVDETSVTIEQAGTPVENPFSIELSVGAKYIVTWDSIAYECTAYVDEYETISLGNGEIVGISGGNSEPFFITVYDGAVMMTANEAGTYTISIQAPYEIITPIPEKYLPEGVIPDEVTITFTVTGSDVTADVTHNDLLNAWRNGAKIKAMLTGSPSNDEIAFMGTRGSGGSFFFEYYDSAAPSAVITIAYSAYGINRYQSTLTAM